MRYSSNSRISESPPSPHSLLRSITFDYLYFLPFGISFFLELATYFKSNYFFHLLINVATFFYFIYFARIYRLRAWAMN